MDELFKKLKQPFNGSWAAVESNMAVFEYILFKLPVRSILKFKSISKHWHHVLSTKYFICKHRLCSKGNPKYLVFYEADETEGIFSEMHQMELDGCYTESYVIPDVKSINNLVLISSFNGLICCVNDMNSSLSLFESDVRICNPATREVFLLPRGRSSLHYNIFGLIYANRYHFYKIFKCFTDPINEEEDYVQCEVYSSHTGSWKQLGRVKSWPRMYGNHVCVNEKLYWFTAAKDGLQAAGSILMVDMNDTFTEIKLPEDKGEYFFLIEFCGRLCYVVWTGFYVCMWLYEEKNDRWQVLEMPKFPVHWDEVLHFDSVTARQEEILFVYKDTCGLRQEIIYDARHKIWKYFSIAENHREKPIFVFPFFETLLPCRTLF